tara:strand:+ start:1342 stop:1629 length:288 start_codon:yes stop_codon:yes gene_type:complete
MKRFRLDEKCNWETIEEELFGIGFCNVGAVEQHNRLSLEEEVKELRSQNKVLRNSNTRLKNKMKLYKKTKKYLEEKELEDATNLLYYHINNAKKD